MHWTCPLGHCNKGKDGVNGCPVHGDKDFVEIDARLLAEMLSSWECSTLIVKYSSLDN